MPDARMKIELGKRYRDAISGWEGVATARYEYMNGCVRYELAAHDKDGKPEAFVFDEQQIVECATSEPVEATARAGGPRGAAPVPR